MDIFICITDSLCFGAEANNMIVNQLDSIKVKETINKANLLLFPKSTS